MNANSKHDPDREMLIKASKMVSEYSDLIALLKSQLESAMAAKASSLETVAALIRSGVTTGNEINDFVACHPELFSRYNADYRQLVQIVTDWYQAIGESGGQPVLIDHYEVRSDSFIHYLAGDDSGTESNLMPPPSRDYLHHTVDFGILCEAQLFFDISNIPASAFVFSFSWNRLETGMLEMQPSPAARINEVCQEIDLPGLANIWWQKFSPRDLAFNSGINLIIGSSALDKWLDENWRNHSCDLQNHSLFSNIAKWSNSISSKSS